jgi:hypothetical protein
MRFLVYGLDMPGEWSDVKKEEEFWNRQWPNPMARSASSSQTCVLWYCRANVPRGGLTTHTEPRGDLAEDKLVNASSFAPTHEITSSI